MGDEKTVSKIKKIKLGGKLLEWWERQEEEEGDAAHHVRQALRLYIEFQKNRREEYISFVFEDSSAKNNNNNPNNISDYDINTNIDENIKLEKEKTEEDVDLKELNKNLDSF